MSTLNIIQISLEAWGAVFCFVTMLVTMYRSKKRAGKLLGKALFINALILVFDAFCYIYRGDTSKVGFVAVRVFNYLVFMNQFILLAFVAEYIYQILTDRGLTSNRKKINSIMIVAAFGMLLVTISQFVPFVYNFDDENCYYRMNGWYFIIALHVLLLSLGTIVVLLKRDKLQVRERRALYSYIYMPLIMLLIQTCFYGMSLINLGTTLSLIAMYISNEIEEIEEYSRMKVELSEQIAETERQSAEAEKQRAEAEKRKLDSERSMHVAFENKMNLLLGQMQPHFVYNSLATIRALVSVDPDGAIETIDHFSSYLRKSLAITDGTKLVPFSEELQLIEDYLYMEKRRFGDKVNIERDIQTTDFEVPPLAIQTLVENAVRHGIRAKNNPGTITISTYEDEEKYYVEIKDDGVGFDTLVKSDGKHHIGTASTRARVKELLGGKMVIQSALGAGTRITVHIPKRV